MESLPARVTLLVITHLAAAIDWLIILTTDKDRLVVRLRAQVYHLLRKANANTKFLLTRFYQGEKVRKTNM